MHREGSEAHLRKKKDSPNQNHHTPPRHSREAWPALRYGRGNPRLGPGGRVSPARGGNVRRTKGDRGTTDSNNTRPYGLYKGSSTREGGGTNSLSRSAGEGQGEGDRGGQKGGARQTTTTPSQNRRPNQPQPIMPIIPNHAHLGSHRNHQSSHTPQPPTNTFTDYNPPSPPKHPTTAGEGPGVRARGRAGPDYPNPDRLPQHPTHAHHPNPSKSLTS